MASQPRARIDRLPTELLFLVAKDCCLWTGDLAALAATCRKCYTITNPILYQRHLKRRKGQALMWAVENKRFTTIRRFLENGANINNDRMFPAYVKQKGKAHSWSVGLQWHRLSVFTPLALAAALGHDSMVAFLLDHGADMEKPGKGLCDCCDGKSTPELDVPPMKGRGTEVDADFMMDEPEGMWWTPLHFALCRGHESTAMILLQRGANPRVTCPCIDGPWNALHTATRLKQLDVINHILDNKLVDINEPGHDGLTPLLLAFYEEHYSLVDMYMSRGADVNAVWKSQNGGWTAFGMACLREDFSRASELLLRGADPDLVLKEWEFGTEWTALGLLYGNLYGDYLRESGWRYDFDHARDTRARRTLEERIIKAKIDKALLQQGKGPLDEVKHRRRRSC